MHVLFPSYRDSDLYLPLYDWQTRTVWPKTSKLDLLKKKRHLHLGCKLIDTKFNFKVNYPFNVFSCHHRMQLNTCMHIFCWILWANKIINLFWEWKVSFYVASTSPHDQTCLFWRSFLFMYFLSFFFFCQGWPKLFGSQHSVFFYALWKKDSQTTWGWVNTVCIFKLKLWTFYLDACHVVEETNFA